MRSCAEIKVLLLHTVCYVAVCASIPGKQMRRVSSKPVSQNNRHISENNRSEKSLHGLWNIFQSHPKPLLFSHPRFFFLNMTACKKQWQRSSYVAFKHQIQLVKWKSSAGEDRGQPENKLFLARISAAPAAVDLPTHGSAASSLVSAVSSSLPPISVKKQLHHRRVQSLHTIPNNCHPLPLIPLSVYGKRILHKRPCDTPWILWAPTQISPTASLPAHWLVCLCYLNPCQVSATA